MLKTAAHLNWPKLASSEATGSCFTRSLNTVASGALDPIWQEIIYQLAYPAKVFTTAPKGWLVAFSGGVDSRVLLELVARANKISSIPVKAIHINHQINTKANEWEQRCALEAAKLRLPFISRTLPKNLGKANLEERLRKLRYEAFQKALTPGWGLLLAHHAGDQAETLLLQLMRGAGAVGLAGMPVYLTAWFQGFSWRPLLNLTRQEILAFAKSNHLTWIEDDSNADTSLKRNWVRHELLPLIIKQQPAATKVFKRSAECFAESAALLEEVARRDWDLTQKTALNARTCIVNFRTLEALPKAHLNNFWYFFWRHLGLSAPSKNWLDLFLRTLSQAKEDAKVYFNLKQLTIWRYQDKVYFLPKGAAFKCSVNMVTFPDGREFKLVLTLGESCWRTLNLSAKVERADGAIRSWGKLAQNLKIPPWWRTSIPTLWHKERLVLVPGFWAARGWGYQESS